MHIKTFHLQSIGIPIDSTWNHGLAEENMGQSAHCRQSAAAGQEGGKSGGSGYSYGGWGRFLGGVF